jgi:hypothetical protein
MPIVQAFYRFVSFLKPRLAVYILLVLLLPLSFPLFAQDEDLRGLKVVVGKLEGGTAVVGRQYAVLIAIDKYNSWVTLGNPVKDAREIKAILARRYYVTDFMELYDEAATKAGIIRLFNRLIETAKPEDSLFIFYAGHGYLDKTSNTGFWVPVDGGVDLDKQENWLPNSQIRGFISNMKERHVVLIADSCFSGDILNPSRGLAPQITDEYFKNAYARISRQVLTSGASESVPDKSPFTQQLKLALEGNTSPYLDPLMLYSQIRLGVKGTTPLFGDLKDSGHQEGSSFLFFLKPSDDQKGSSDAEGLTPKMKIVKAYGTATIATDMPGTLFLDGVSQGQIPIGSVATIENLAVGPHQLELFYDDGERSTQTVTVMMGKNLVVDFNRAAKTASKLPPAETTQETPAPAAKSTTQPQTLLDGKPLPVASFKIDGNFDKWQNIPPVIVSSLGPDDNKSIRKVYLARDAENLFIKLDIADKTPSSSFHAHNFDENPGPATGSYGSQLGRFYAIKIDTGESQDNFNVVLARDARWGGNWYGVFGVREKGNLRLGARISGPIRMTGSSVEMAVLWTVIQDYFDDLGPAKPYRVTAWTAKGTSPLEELRETETGFFSLGNEPQAEPVSRIKLPDDKFDYLTAFEGHQYYISKTTATWTEANSLCQKYGGHLVTITSDSQNKVLLQAIQQKSINQNIWIGLRKGMDGKWRWVTHEKVDFTYWHPGQPDNYQGNQDVVNIWLAPSPWLKAPGKWDDMNSGQTDLFILEME